METKERPIVDSVDALETAIRRVREAEALYARYTQEQVDAIFRAAAIAANQARIPLAKLAVEETGMGVVEDKVIKNNYAAEYIYNAYRNTRTCGVIEEDKAYGMMKIAEPLGVIAAVIPTTNPTSTAIFKCLLALKTRNAIIISPHPRAKKSTIAAARLVLDAAVAAGAPAGIIDWIDMPSLDMTNLLMKEADIILATGGPGMVKAAYSSGKPALGVGAGNVQCLVDRDANLKEIAPKIISGRSSDNGILCTCEQSVICPRESCEELAEELEENGAYYVSRTDEITRLTDTIFPDGEHANRVVIGRPAAEIAQLAGITVPEDTKVLLIKADGMQQVLGHEKLFPVLSLFSYDSWEEGIELVNQNLSLDVLGEVVHLHPAYLSKIFKEVTNMNLSAYITDIRMQKAAELLEQTELKVHEVMELIGYRKSQYFSRLFKERFGVTPVEYRRTVKKDLSNV